MSTYKQLLDFGVGLAEEHDKEESAIRMLLLHFSKLESYQLVAELFEQASEECIEQYKKGVHQYIFDNVPVQHIIGYEYFYGHKFIVNKDVLIPRNETEELVANILMYYDEIFDGAKIDLVDIGTGSGCLGVTLAKEETENIKVTCTDISTDALQVAKQNASNLGVNVNFLAGDMLKPLEGMKFDIIVSNPPYIPEEEYVESLVKDNEPHVALFGGSDGMKFYRIILEGARALLKNENKFIIAFEHAYDKGQEMEELAKLHFPDARYILLQDMQGRDRMSFVIKG